MLLQDERGECLFFAPVTANELLSGLDPIGRKAISSIEAITLIPPDVMVFEPGDLPSSLYVHLSGKAVHVSGNGLEIAILACPISSHHIYGLVEALSGGTFQAGLKTITACEFGVIDQVKLLGYIRHQPALCFRLAEILSRSYQEAVKTIRSN